MINTFKILSDPERKSMFDDYGSTREPRQSGHHEGGFYGDFPFHGFESFFGQGYGFNFNRGQQQQNRKSSEEAINKK